jgi:hypothetical protein
MSSWESLWWMGPSRVEPDNVQLGVSILDGFGEDLELIDLIIFTSFNTPLLILRCSYTQEI